MWDTALPVACRGTGWLDSDPPSGAPLTLPSTLMPTPLPPLSYHRLCLQITRIILSCSSGHSQHSRVHRQYFRMYTKHCPLPCPALSCNARSDVQQRQLVWATPRYAQSPLSNPSHTLQGAILLVSERGLLP